jgi:hypothetical protein
MSYSTPEHFVSINSLTALEVLGLLIIDVSKAPRSVGLLWASDGPAAETSTLQHTTLTRGRQLCPQQDSNRQSKQVSSRRLTPWTERLLGSAERYVGTNEISLLWKFCVRAENIWVLSN